MCIRDSDEAVDVHCRGPQRRVVDVEPPGTPHQRNPSLGAEQLPGIRVSPLRSRLRLRLALLPGIVRHCAAACACALLFCRALYATEPATVATVNSGLPNATK